jgi:glycosyltransferase involved in cell wall biosynthesis
VENGNLLIITNNYPDSANLYNDNIFVKEQINYLRHCFNNIFVISPVPFGKSYYRKRSYRDYSYDNVCVFFPKYINLPFLYFIGRKIWLRRALQAVEGIIRKNNIKFDIIHSHFTWPSGCIGVRLAEKYKCPIVISEHSSNTVEKAIRKREKIFINAWQKCDALIRVRAGDSEGFFNSGVPESKFHIIPIGFDPQKFYPLDKGECRRRLDLPNDKNIILTISNPYSKVKGHKYLIEAMRLLSHETNDLICIIIGDGKLSPKLEAQIAKSGLKDTVIMVGSKPHNELVYWLNAADLFVLPSLNEGNPTVLVEALGAGTPYVGTNVGGIPWVVINEDLGLLCEPGNSKALARVVLLGIEKEWDKDKIYQYSQTFTMENIANRIMSIYKQLRM